MSLIKKFELNQQISPTASYIIIIQHIVLISIVELVAIFHHCYHHHQHNNRHHQHYNQHYNANLQLLLRLHLLRLLLLVLNHMYYNDEVDLYHHCN